MSDLAYRQPMSDVPITAMRAPAQNLGETERVISGVLGGAMALWGIRHGGVAGGLAALTGAALIGRGATGYCPITAAVSARPAERRIAWEHGWRTAAAISRSVTIAKEPEEVYRFFRDFSNLPRFMRHLERVEVQSDTLSHWVVRAPGGRVLEWDAVITEDRPNERIAWETAPDADVKSAGWVEFRRAPGGRGTELRARITYEPPGGQIGRLVASLWGEEPGRQAHDDLRRLKQVMETGEIPTPALRKADAEAAAPASA